MFQGFSASAMNCATKLYFSFNLWFLILILTSKVLTAHITMTSFFNSVELLPEDPILGLQVVFAADPRESKVNLGIGSYKNEQGKPFVLPSVRKAEKIIFDRNLDKEYLPIVGNGEFIQVISKLIFGQAEQHAVDNRCIVQTVGGTAAMRIAGEFLAKNRHMAIYLPDPTWPNHRPVFTYAGMNVRSYPYYHKESHDLDFQGLCDFLKKIPSPAVILFHSSCHNPTGIDPTNDQWREISEIVKKQKLIPFFDCAYQGFGVGIEEDVFAVRYFFEQGHEMFVSYSCSKNFGLYGERVGALCAVMKDPQITKRVVSQFKQIIRGIYSMPPLQGSRIVSTILHSPELTQEWKREVQSMREHVKKMRTMLVAGLERQGVNRDVKFFETQKGIFSYTGIPSDQVKLLKKDYGIYLTTDGRINIAGLNEGNIEYVVSSISNVIK